MRGMLNANLMQLLGRRYKRDTNMQELCMGVESWKKDLTPVSDVLSSLSMLPDGFFPQQSYLSILCLWNCYGLFRSRGNSANLYSPRLLPHYLQHAFLNV